MSSVFITTLVLLAGSALVLFAMRRAVFLVAALMPPRPLPDSGDNKSVTLVISACNEAAGIDRTLDAIERLDYPADRLFVVVVNDCSDDRTGEHLARWSASRPRSLALDLPERLGKPRAVRYGAEAAPVSELVAIFDADVQPRADALRNLTGPFIDPTVGAVTGYLTPEDPLASPTSRYAALESWMHQLITSAAKDRLDLNPPTSGGGAAYRRAALEQIGWLGSARSGDDVRATVALTRAGWRTRFIGVAVAENSVARNWREYWRQHIRWARDLFESARISQMPARAGIPWRRRLESAMLSAGYLDRVVFFLALIACASGHMTLWLPAAYLGLRGVEICVAVAKGVGAGELPAFLVSLPVFFALDVLASLRATVEHVARRPRALDAPLRREKPKFGSGN